MKAVLISIQPKWCGLIASGEKTIEVRKTKPCIDYPFKCYIYETQGKTEEPWMDEDGHMIFRGRGMVIGEFVCDKISIFRPKSITCESAIKKASCLTVQGLIDYAGNKDHIFWWHISDLVIYDEPKPLSEFERPCKCIGEYEGETYCDCLNCDDAGDSDYGIIACGRELNRPPQSWCYVEEVTANA